MYLTQFFGDQFIPANNGQGHGLFQSEFKDLPLNVYLFHEFLEALLTFYVDKEEIVFHQKRIIDEPLFYAIFYPIYIFILIVDERIAFCHPDKKHLIIFHNPLEIF
jgi:hypothetical protein